MGGCLGFQLHFVDMKTGGAEIGGAVERVGLAKWEWEGVEGVAEAWGEWFVGEGKGMNEWCVEGVRIG